MTIEANTPPAPGLPSAPPAADATDPLQPDTSAAETFPDPHSRVSAAPTLDAEPDVAVFDAYPPGAEKDFVIPPMIEPDAKLTPNVIGELAEADKMARGWLAAAKLTREIGNHVADEVAATARATAKMDDTSYEIWRREQHAIMARQWGGVERVESKLTIARQLIREIEATRPGLVDLLNRSGAGDSAAVAIQLVLHANRLCIAAARKS